MSAGAAPKQRLYPFHADGITYTLPPLLESQLDHEWRVTRHWSITDTLDKTKYLSWNLHGQLLSSRDYPNAQTLYYYDADGHLSESINAHGEHTHYRYDARGYLIVSERPKVRIDRYDRSVSMPWAIPSTSATTPMFACCT